MNGNKIIDKHQAVCGVVWIVVFCIIILRPFRLIVEKPVVRSNQQISMQSGEIWGDCMAAQKFVAPYNHIQNIKIYFLNEPGEREFRFILFDADMNVVTDKNFYIDGEELPGFYNIKLNQDVEAGSEYCYMIQGIFRASYVAYEETGTSGTIYNGALFYGGVEVAGHNIITEYDYEQPFGQGKARACYAAVVLTGVLIFVLSKKYYDKHPEKNTLITVGQVWKRAASPIVVVAALACMIAIWPCNLFSNEAGNYVLFNALDIIFYETGILIAAGILLYGINHRREHKSNDMGLPILRERWTDYLQAVFFALAIQSGVHYMNALYENHHLIAYREMLVYFGLAVIVTYKRKEIFNLVNAVYLAIAAIAGYFYYNAQVMSVVTEDDMKILKLTIFAAVIAGIVIINTVFILARRQIGRISGYGIILAVFFALLIIFRNTRGWPVYLVCVFLLYYLRMSAWEKKERLLENICNGILLNFLVLTGYCLMHRLYLYHVARFSFMFHTVTVTAEYLSLTTCAAFVRLMQAYRREPKLACIWKELTLFGISTVYLILTLSRTGYLATIVMLLVAVPVVCLGKRRMLKAVSALAAILIAAVIVCFPAVFTLQRIIPAVVAKPEVFDIERVPDELRDERNMDSWEYMTIRRFIQVFEMKVIGIPEEKCVVPYVILYYGNSDIDRMLVASAAPLSGAEFSAGEEMPPDTLLDSYANGRLDIFKMYIANLNMSGHDTMEIIMPDGVTKAVHAHNTYLQVAYDHGIPVGIAFIIFGVCTLIQAAVYYKRRKEDRACSLLPFALLFTFAGAGLTEWLFHPCNPLTFCLLLTLAPLLCDNVVRLKKGRLQA